MLPSDMNLRIGNVRNYNNKIMVSKPGFNLGTNLKINLDGEQAKLKDKPDVKSKEVEMVKAEPDVKHKVKDKPDIKPNKGDKQDVKPVTKPNKEHKQDDKPNIKFDRESNQDVKKPDTNKITYEEEKAALILGMTTVFTVWYVLK